MTDIAFQTPAFIIQKQLELLKEQLLFISEQSPYYRQLFLELNIFPGDIRSLEDLSSLPFTTKDILSEHNQEFICVPRERIVEYVTTSGTLGSPVTIALSERDLQRLALNECNALRTAGGTSMDTYQIMVTLDRRFMAGMAYYLGARMLGAGIVRSGVDSPAFQFDTIQRLKPTACIAVPSFVIKLIEYAEAEDIDLNSLSIRKLICIGEPIRASGLEPNALASRIQESWDLKLYSTYASTEMATAFTECDAGRGGHHQPDLIIAEILNNDDQPVKDGEPGELVITTLGVEAMPLLRFRTGDICRRYSEPCTCGRNSYRLGPVEGRKQQMIKYKGTTLYPASLFDVLNACREVLNYVVVVDSDSMGMDRVEISIVLSDKSTSVLERLRDDFLRSIRVVPQMQIISESEYHEITYSPMSRKAIRFIDQRRPQSVIRLRG